MTEPERLVVVASEGTLQWIDSRNYRAVGCFGGVIFQRRGVTFTGQTPPVVIAKFGETLVYEDERITVEKI